MSAEMLREAAALMRSRAEVGGPLDYPPPWRVQKCDLETHGLASIVVCHEDGSGDVTDVLDDSMAEYIASWQPPVALAVADWLATCARLYEYGDVGPLMWDSALTVARAYLGTAPSPVAPSTEGGESR